MVSTAYMYTLATNLGTRLVIFCLTNIWSIVVVEIKLFEILQLIIISSLNCMKFFSSKILV